MVCRKRGLSLDLCSQSRAKTLIITKQGHYGGDKIFYGVTISQVTIGALVHFCCMKLKMSNIYSASLSIVLCSSLGQCSCMQFLTVLMVATEPATTALPSTGISEPAALAAADLRAVFMQEPNWLSQLPLITG